MFYKRSNSRYNNRNVSFSKNQKYTRKRSQTKVIDGAWTPSWERQQSNVGMDRGTHYFDDFTRQYGCDQGTSIRERIGNRIKLKNTAFKISLTAATVLARDEKESSVPGQTDSTVFSGALNIVTNTNYAGPGAPGYLAGTNGQATVPAGSTGLKAIHSAGRLTDVYVRTVFRIVMILDRHQQDDKKDIALGEVFEGYSEGSMTEASTPPPSVFSYLNAANFGRYQILYDKTYVCDRDDPTKMVNFNLKTFNMQHYSGSGATSVRSGSVYWTVLAFTPDSISGNAVGTPPAVYLNTRTSFTDC